MDHLHEAPVTTTTKTKTKMEVEVEVEVEVVRAGREGRAIDTSIKITRTTKTDLHGKTRRIPGINNMIRPSRVRENRLLRISRY